LPLTSGSPLPDGRRSLGVIGYYRPGRRAYSPTERELMDELAIRAGLALHRAELLAAAQRAATRLQAGIELTVDLASALDSSEVIRRLLRRALVLLEADRSVLARVEGDQIAIDDAYDTEGRAAGVGERYEISFRPTVQQAIVSGQMAFGAPALFGLPDAVRAAYAEMRHTATCPLYLDGRIGAVLIVARKADRTFDSEDREMLSLLSNAAVIALRNANLYSQAQEAVRAKSDFLNLAAHELRTPLSVVNGYLSMLRDGSLGDPPSLWARPLAVMAGKVRELGQLVDDLLLAARLETGSVASGASTFDLRLVVREALARAEPRARLLDASVSHQMPSDAVLVSGDPEHVGRILDNLINNSLSYSPGRPWVRVSVIASRRPCVEVEDRGAGVPPEAREKIFERFFRGEGEGVTHPPGTGLGLYISRQLAERNGGALELVESEVGRGSTFRLTLPAPVAAVKPLEAAPPPA
jgi:signal transduction histidine kinase